VADPVEPPDHDAAPPDGDAAQYDPTATADVADAAQAAIAGADQQYLDQQYLDQQLDESLVEIAEQAQPDRRKLISRVLLLLVSAVAFYVLAPAIGEVFTTWDRLGETEPLWLIGAFLAEAASFASLWWLFKIAMPGVSWFTIGCSQLAANALSRVVPGGAAPGGALQYRMLADGEADRTQAASGLTAVSLLSTATLFAIPVLTIPTVAFGRPVPAGLAQAAWVGGVLFVALAGITAWLLGPDGGVRFIARGVATLRKVFARQDTDVRALADRLIGERNKIRAALGERWAKALFASAGKWGFDYLCLVAALSAVGSSPRPSLVLLAYTAAQILGMIPITPGGVGFVEAGLTATLTLAGVGAADAALATLIYRLMSFWLPLPAGLVAWGLFRARVRHRLAKSGSPGPGPATT
jgi:hypothetical protein